MTPGLLTLLTLSALDVQWLAPPSCAAPDLSLLATGASGRAEVRITSDAPTRWVLELAFLEPFQATRRLELGSCADARRAARALLVLGLKGADAFQQAEVPLPAPPLTASEPLPPPPPPAPRATGPVLTLRLQGLATVLALPAVTPRFGLAGALRFGALELELGVRAGVPATFPGGPTSTATVALWPTLGGELLGCLGVSVGRLRPAGCASVVTEWWQLAGAGVSSPGRGSAALLSAGAVGRLGFTLGAGFELGVSVAFRGNLLRPTAEFAGQRALTTGPVTLEGGAFLGFAPGSARND